MSDLGAFYLLAVWALSLVLFWVMGFVKGEKWERIQRGGQAAREVAEDEN